MNRASGGAVGTPFLRQEWWRRRREQRQVRMILAKSSLILMWFAIVAVIGAAAYPSASRRVLNWRYDDARHCVVCDDSLAWKPAQPTEDYAGRTVEVVCKDCWRDCTDRERAALYTHYLWGYFTEQDARIHRRYRFL